MPGGDLEYAVMNALWELGSGSVRDVHERVGEGDGLVYTTTAKVIDRLHAKRLVTRHRDGRSFVYRPAIARDAVDRFRTKNALDTLFGDAPRPAIATLVETIESIDPDLLEDLAREVRKRRSRRGT
jgi:predicted transcriptional regulator